ncbi:retrovirus-related Pol polyprotein from transposon TNT 1-94 [Trichonephila clavipes]|nr:retrovirus-related Pol polyprotein from transposon TNT 1-94 [Trichonephila clavipes]
MNSVASTLNRVTDMEFNNQISVLTQNNWNTWKHDMQVLLMHYGCWQFIMQTKPEQPDEEATYKEKLDLQLRKDRCYTLIYTNISSDLKNLITETTDGVTAWKILKDHFEPVTRARAFQLIRWLPQEFQSTVQQIYRWKEEDFRVVKIEAELILEANRLQLMKQDLEKAENAYLSSFTLKKSKTLPGATAAAHGDPNDNNDYQKKSEIWHQRFCHVNNDYLVKTSKNDSVKGLPRLTDNGKTHCIPCKLAKSKRVSFKKTGAVRSKRPLELLHMDLCGPMPTESQGGNKYFLSIIDYYSRKVTVFPIRNKSDVFHTFIRFQKRAERFLSKKVIAVRTDGGLEFCNKDMDNFLTELGIKHEVTNSYTPEMNGVAERFNLTALDGIKTLLKSSEVPHKFWGEALLCFTYAWNRICHKDSNKTHFEKYSGRKPSIGIASKTFWMFGIRCIEGEATRLKSFNEIERYCKRRNIEYDPSLFNFRKDNTESQGFSDLSEQQALMVEVTIPNCYKQAIRSRDASKWHDAMDKEINVMMEQAWRVVGRLEGGQTQAEVAQAIGVSQSVISRIWSRFLETGSAGRRPGQGRRWATTPNEDRYLVLTARRHRNINATLLQQHLRSATGTRVSQLRLSVRNRLHSVVPFPIQLDNRRIFIWRDHGSRNNPAFVHESVRFGGGGVLVYGGISIDGRTDLYIIRDGPLTARRYRPILRPIVVPYAAAIRYDFILMDDNCRPHRDNLVEDFFFEEGIVRMEWPACSPDMNPIEHV